MTKIFDCIEMKRRAQEEPRTEYEIHKIEFTSYVDFLIAKADQTPWVRQMREKINIRN
jgi:hypothetical protein